MNFYDMTFVEGQTTVHCSMLDYNTNFVNKQKSTCHCCPCTICQFCRLWCYWSISMFLLGAFLSLFFNHLLQHFLVTVLLSGTSRPVPTGQTALTLLTMSLLVDLGQSAIEEQMYSIGFTQLVCVNTVTEQPSLLFFIRATVLSLVTWITSDLY